MQLSQYGAMGEADRPCEKIMAELLESLRSSYDYINPDSFFIATKLCQVSYETA